MNYLAGAGGRRKSTPAPLPVKYGDKSTAKINNNECVDMINVRIISMEVMILRTRDAQG
jgi:hypothetical protein